MLRGLLPRPALSRCGIVAVAAFALAVALPVQPPGCSQTAHFALIRSLARGEPEIDRYHWQTCDKVYTRGHFYANKAPLTAFVGVPLWFVLRALGADDPLPSTQTVAALYDVPAAAMWPFALLASALPTVVLVVLVAALASRVAPGYGVATGIAVGAGTLLFPLGTILIAHALAALLGFAAFAVLFAERDRRARLPRVAAAGVLAGLAVTAEYPLALVGAGLLVYALRRGEGVRRGLTFAAGCSVGAVLLAAYNTWAFGSPRTLSYDNAVIDQGQSGHDRIGQHEGGFYGISVPSPEVALELLFAQKGLVVVAPVTAAAVAGLVPLARCGFRREAWLVGGLGGAFLVYLAGYSFPFGGDGPGPRFFAGVLPFLGLPLACAFARRPLTTGVLTLTSAATLLLAVITEPVLGGNDTDRWLERALDGDFTQTALSLVGVDHRTLAVLPVVVFAVLAVAAAAVAVPRRRIAAADARLAVAALAAWALVASTVARALTPDVADGVAHVVAAAAAVAACAAAVALFGRPASRPPARASASDGPG